MVCLHIYHYRFSLELLSSNDKPLKLTLSAISKKVGHIERKIDDAVFNLHILLVENERCVKVLCIFRPVFVKRCRGIFASALDFYGRYVVIGHCAGLGDEEVYFHPVRGVGSVGAGVEIEFVPCAAKHLGYNVLDDHSGIYLNVVIENPIVDVCCREFVLIEREADEQSRVAEVTFECRPVHVEAQSDIRFARAIADVNGHGALEPFERAVKVADAGVGGYRGHSKFLFVLGKLCRDLAEYGSNLLPERSRKLVDICAVEAEDVPFLELYLVKVACRGEGRDGLRHAPNHKVLPEYVHYLTVRVFPDGKSLSETLFN